MSITFTVYHHDLSTPQNSSVALFHWHIWEVLHLFVLPTFVTYTRVRSELENCGTLSPSQEAIDNQESETHCRSLREGRPCTPLCHIYMSTLKSAAMLLCTAAEVLSTFWSLVLPYMSSKSATLVTIVAICIWVSEDSQNPCDHRVQMHTRA